MLCQRLSQKPIERTTNSILDSACSMNSKIKLIPKETKTPSLAKVTTAFRQDEKANINRP